MPTKCLFAGHYAHCFPFGGLTEFSQDSYNNVFFPPLIEETFQFIQELTKLLQSELGQNSFHYAQLLLNMTNFLELKSFIPYPKSSMSTEVHDKLLVDLYTFFGIINLQLYE